jgi:hypothetical protein
VTDRLDEALAVLVRKPARRDLRARVLELLAETKAPARPRWVPAAALAAAVGALVAAMPLAWRWFHRMPPPTIVAVASPPAERAAPPAVDATPVSAASPTAPVVRARRIPAQPRVETNLAAIETDLAIAPLVMPATIPIAPIEAERTVITSVASDPIVIPPLETESVPGQEETP